MKRSLGLALASLFSFVFGTLAEQSIPLHDGDAPAAGWEFLLMDRAEQPADASGEIEVVPGPAGDRAVRLRGHNLRRHAFASPEIAAGPWAGQNYSALGLWYRGDGSDNLAMLYVSSRVPEINTTYAYRIELHLRHLEWKYVMLEGFLQSPTVPPPDLSTLSGIRVIGPRETTFELSIGTLSLLSGGGKIETLKTLHLDTHLVESGRPAATIVVPATAAGLEAGDDLQQHLRQATGLEFPVVAGPAPAPAELLARRHVIALGCMADNPFIAWLYRHWWTLADRWYPGPGGHVLRSLHNPCATGRNVLLLGASDDAGLTNAVKAFAAKLGTRTAIDWMLEVQLGAGHEMPEAADQIPVLLRPFADGVGPANGWSPAGKLALQYVYSGRREYAERFKQLAYDNPKSITHADHYGGGQTHCLMWDLIEESPVFSDEDRLYITGLFLEHLRGGEAARGLARLAAGGEAGRLPERHGMTKVQGAAAATRYFARYYPSPEFDRYARLCQTYFEPLLGAGKAQNDVGLGRYTTYLEPVLGYALLHDREDFFRGDPLRAWIDRLIAHVPPFGASGRERPFIPLRTAAQLLGDPQVRFVAELALNQPTEALYEFGSGQAWAGDVRPVKPSRYTGIHVIPPEPLEFRAFDFPVPVEEGYDKITLRSSFAPEAIWLLLDGVDGGPGGKRTPDVNAIKWVGGLGHLFLRWWSGSQYSQNAVCVSKDGVSQELPRAGELVRTTELPDFGHVHVRTARYPWSQWDRHLLWDRRQNRIAVCDAVTAQDDGHYLVSTHWIPFGATYLAVDGQVQGDARGFRIVCSSPNIPTATLHVGNVLGLPHRDFTTMTGGPMRIGEQRWTVHLLTFRPGDDNEAPQTKALGPNVFLIEGEDPVLLGCSSAPDIFGDAAVLDARAFRLSPDMLAASGLTRLAIGRDRFAPSAPVDLELHMDGTGTLVVAEDTDIEIACAQNATVSIGPARTQVRKGVAARCRVPQGTHALQGLPGLGASLSDLFQKVAMPAVPQPRISTLPDEPLQWNAAKAAAVPAKCTALTADGDGAILGHADGTVRAIEADGSERWVFTTEGQVNALLAPASGSLPFRVLAGSDDGRVYALNDRGHAVWSCELRTLKPGERRSPFIREFLLADLTGDGTAEIVVANSERWLTAINAADGTELWATCMPPARPHGTLLSPRSLPVAEGVADIVIGDSWFFGGGWFRLDAQGNITLNRSSMWGGGRNCGMAVCHFEADRSPAVCVATYRVTDAIRCFRDGAAQAWEVHTDEPVTAMTPVALDDGRSLLVAGVRSGWITALDGQGRVAWRHCVAEPVKDLLPVRNGHLVAALADGRLLLLTNVGQVVGVGSAGSKTYQIGAVHDGATVMTATAKGELRSFAIPPRP